MSGSSIFQTLSYKSLWLSLKNLKFVEKIWNKIAGIVSIFLKFGSAGEVRGKVSDIKLLFDTVSIKSSLPTVDSKVNPLCLFCNTEIFEYRLLINWTKEKKSYSFGVLL